jgi:antitoxin (DNA-binding transcriptional repressor) of toxin-antitoxin stability system
MRAVGLKILKNKLSEYVRMAAGGETILVTDRDRVVAELRPPSEGRSPVAEDALLADLVKKGWLTPPRSVRKGPLPSHPAAPLSEILKELDEDRADR